MPVVSKTTNPRSGVIPPRGDPPDFTSPIPFPNWHRPGSDNDNDNDDNDPFSTHRTSLDDLDNLDKLNPTDNRALSTGAIAAIVVGVVVLFLLIIGLAAFLYTRKRRAREEERHRTALHVAAKEEDMVPLTPIVQPPTPQQHTSTLAAVPGAGPVPVPGSQQQPRAAGVTLADPPPPYVYHDSPSSSTDTGSSNSHASNEEHHDAVVARNASQSLLRRSFSRRLSRSVSGSVISHSVITSRAGMMSPRSVSPLSSRMGGHEHEEHPGQRWGGREDGSEDEEEDGAHATITDGLVRDGRGRV
ncbi:hypothetical protein B0J18DRAFT_414277 [Chaetomium sp. MPI-SDFR-AT-0129]|nr:hypothetical protein B0J18DRAFT_414277 [Chaetomium sp. MPI-SDFR-AT-0129]